MSSGIDAARLRALADPLRLRMGLLLIEDALTVKELAAALDVPPTRLYYHVKILEEHALVEVVERRMVSGIEERRYRAVTDNWVASPDTTASAVEASGLIPSLFSAIRAEVEVVLHDHPNETVGEVDSAVPIVTVTELRLRPEDVEAVQQRLHAINEEFNAVDGAMADGAPRYRFMFVGYQVPGGHRAP